MTWLTLGMGMLDLNVFNRIFTGLPLRKILYERTWWHIPLWRYLYLRRSGMPCTYCSQFAQTSFFQCICDDSYKLGARDIIAVRRVYVQAIFLHKNYFGLELSEGKFFFCNIVGNVKLDYHLCLIWWTVCCYRPLKGSGERGYLGSAFIEACNVFYRCIVLFVTNALLLAMVFPQSLQ